MRNSNYGMYALAAAVAVVGALWIGLPVGTVAFLLLIVACPLMMILMMRGMHGGGHGAEEPPASNRAGHEHGQSS